MLLPIKIALRFLKSSKGQTLLITLGIAIGVSVQIFIGLLIQGLQGSLVDKTIGSSPHITITAEEDFNTYEDVFDIVESDFAPKAMTATFDNPAFIDIDAESRSVLVRGFTLDGANKIYKFSDALIKGTLPKNANDVIIGKSVFEEGGYTLGQAIDLNLPGGVAKQLNISGVFDLKVSAINNTWFITDINTAQTMFGKEDVASSVEIQIDDVFSSDVLAANLKTLLPAYSVVDWQAQNEELLSGLSGQSISSIMIQVFVIIAVVLGIASVLAISVLQKSKQIGILKAMGIKDGASSVIFLTQGFVLGVLGALVGLILGLGLIVAFSKFALNPDGSPLIPITINAGFIALSGGIAIFASMAASLIPAFRSMKMDPIEVIKNG